MKLLHDVITVFVLAMIFFSSDVVLAQNETQPTIEFDEASYSTKNMHCNFYNTGKTPIPNQAHDKVIITVTDSNANKFSTSIDRVSVYVWSDSDTKVMEITAYETEVNSGIFKGKITISDGQSTQDIIHVRDGDTLSARYSSATTGSLDTTNHDVTTTSFIGISCPPFERVPASSIRVLDTRGNENDVTTVGKQVLITSTIANPTGENQNFTYIVQIQDQNGSTASLAWLSGIMLPNQTSSPSVSWTPNNAGNFVVSIFVWQSLTNPNSLSAPLSADLTVLHDFANSKSSISDAKNLHCHLGFELMTKPAGGSPVCVTANTAQKLAGRGWGTSDASSMNSTDSLEKNGIFSGNVVLAGGPSPGPQANYEVDVYATDGITIIGKTLSDANGNYSIQLPAGNYMIHTLDYPNEQTHFVSV